ncbi:5723_t:CDS:2 [Scutellospora calospora]|uniref:5723_t:CDS:1 n=1 Tax=Scutellospora calospora TaxID=85575 RepID=A0ACA9JUG6_9GLOM|nr:5723_t:CDS:2 [Scutellospora calospora]
MSAPKSFTLSKSLPQGGHLQYHPDVNIQSVNQPLIDPEESADNAQKQAILCEYRRRRREAHNSVEHRRRDSINETIQEISTLIPDIYNDSSKLNKDVILDKAIEYIKHLQQMEGEHRAFNMMLENSVKDMKPGIPIKK